MKEVINNGGVITWGAVAVKRVGMFGRRHWPVSCLFAFVLIFLAVKPSWKRPGPAIRSDGAGYQLWTYAILEGNLNFCKYRAPETLNLYPEIETIVHPPSGKRGACQNKYPPGTALLRFPLMGPISWVTHRALVGPFDFTKAEHSASILLGSLFLFGTFLCLTALLRNTGFDGGTAAVFAVLGLLGTGTFHYGTYDNSFSHIGSAFLTALSLLLLTRRKAEGEVRKKGSWVALILGLLTVLVRNTNGLLVVGTFFGIFLGMFSGLWNRQKGLLMGGLVGALLGGGFQLAYNVYSTGTVSLSSYGAERFQWDHPQIWAVLFDLEHGLFVRQPFFAVALFVGLSVKETRREGLGVFLILLCFATLFGFWHSWSLGAGFGHRGFVDMAPIVILLAGKAMHQLDERSTGTRRWSVKAAWMSFAGAASVTTCYMWNYWQK